MTRQEITHTRDLTFSDWIRKKLPDSYTGYYVTDLDFILFNFEKKIIMLIEIKTRNSNLKDWQQRIFLLVSKWIKKGINEGWEYKGFHVIKFENTFFNDGKCYYDNEVIEEVDLIKKLSF